MNFQTQTIDPTQLNLPATAEIQKILSDADRLPPEQHEQAVKAFLLSDGIASGIRKDLAFVDKIPQFIKDIIENKLWECLCVSKGVLTPYYCRYVKGTDSENFRAFIVAKHPNGLESSVETIDRILQGEPEVQRTFRAIIYESRQGERTDIDDSTSHRHDGKLASAQQERIRAANRASEALPVVNDLLDKGLISTEVASMLGKDIKDPNNLTAEEREYVDKRDLIGWRIKQYIYSSPIPEDEDREPQYSRELNGYIKDLLGVKDRSKSVRMDDPKKAADKLLQFYQGESLQKLIDYLQQQAETFQVTKTEETPIQLLNPEPITSNIHHQAKNERIPESDSKASELSATVNESKGSYSTQNDLTGNSSSERTDNGKHPSIEIEPEIPSNNSTKDTLKTASKKSAGRGGRKKSLGDKDLLTCDELAQRLGYTPRTLSNYVCRETTEDFAEHTRKKDPDGLAWQKSTQKRGRKPLFTPLKNDDTDSTPKSQEG
jgi:hypothetical protein